VSVCSCVACSLRVPSCRDLHPLPGKPDLIKSSSTGAATVSLDDCLACSGCVTSAEAVLIEQQSVQELQSAIASKAFSEVVVLVSPQSLAALAVHWSPGPSAPLSLLSALARLSRFLSTQGVTHVMMTTMPSDLALHCAAHEFVARCVQSVTAPTSPPEWKPPPPTQPVSDHVILAVSDSASAASTSLSDLAPLAAASAAAVASGLIPSVETHTGAPAVQSNVLPVLCSECPGWVCYAEKTCSEVIPFMSRAKSGQQIAGALAKHVLCSSIDSTKVYVCSIMPCFDKKLEASRRDFVHDATRTKDVDMVLSTAEVASWMDDSDSSEPDSSSSPVLHAGHEWWEPLADPRVTSSVPGSTSGGYTTFLARYAAQHLWGLATPEAASLSLEFSASRSPDMATASIRRPASAPAESSSPWFVPSGKGLDELVFVRAYGFRNVQAIVSRLRRKRAVCHYVEVMACPSGCSNGGGQIKPPLSSSSSLDVRAATLERAAQVSAVLDERDTWNGEPSFLTRVVAESLFHGDLLSVPARELCFTRFHAVPKLVSPSAIKW
jgi:iron only hydrogenase large subunit-like protein